MKPPHEPEARPRRTICARCARPVCVCLCDSLPTTPLHLSGLVVVLQHPAEQKRALATVPLLELCLSSSSLAVVRCRRARGPLFEALLSAARRPDSPLPLFVLWPGAGAANLAALALQRPPPCDRNPHGLSLTDRLATASYALLVLDGTWQQAQEMAALVIETCVPPGRLARLPFEAVEDAAVLLRSEPLQGCTVTAEAVARAVELLEGGEWGTLLRTALTAPSRLLAAQQRTHDAVGKGVRSSQRLGHKIVTK